MSDEAAELTEAEFQRVRQLLRLATGIDLSSGKQALVFSRLAKRVQTRGLQSFSEYLDLIEENEDEFGDFVSALTTNVTDFFREAHHFESLRAHAMAASPTEELKVWSSACSTGEEAWSIAMTLADLTPSVKFRVLATDIDAEVLKTAAEAVYAEDRVRVVPQKLAEHFLQRHRESGRVRITGALQSHVHFAQLNLLGPWPMTTKFDVIFCRNVLIYFDDATRHRVVERLAEQLRPGGLLLLGHSEGVLGTDAHLEPCGKTAYRRTTRKAA